MAINTLKYIEKFLKIKTKRAEIEPLILNKPQLKLYEVLRQQYNANRPRRVIILKARQMGFSTITEAIIFKNTATTTNIKSAIVAHKEQSTKSLFEMSKLFFDQLPIEMKPETKASNAYELSFDNKSGTGLKSSIICHTAGGKGIGRGDTIHDLHCSEYAFWPDNKKEILSGLLQSVPNTRDTMVIIESTANGYDDFKEKWDKAVNGENDFYPLFVAWYELDEYRMDVRDDFKLQLGGNYGNEIAIKSLYHLDNEQMQWRRWCIENNCNGEIDIFKQEYPSNPEEAFLSTGDSVFNKESVVEQIERARHIQKVTTGYFTYDKDYPSTVSAEIHNISWNNDERGYITIYEEPQVKLYSGKIANIKDVIDTEIMGKNPYVIGGDTAGVGEDYFTAKVINNITKKTAAVLWKQRLDEDLYADQLYCLGKYYHDALIGIEVNYSTQPVRELEKLRYHNQYIRERMDTITNGIVKALGFETNLKTRPVMIAEFVKLVREDITIECDVSTLKEMLTFIKDERGRPQAQEGYHDDLVMATAIAHFISNQMTSTWIEIAHEKKDFIKDNFKLDTQPKEGALEW